MKSLYRFFNPQYWSIALREHARNLRRWLKKHHLKVIIILLILCIAGLWPQQSTIVLGEGHIARPELTKLAAIQAPELKLVSKSRIIPTPTKTPPKPAPSGCSGNKYADYIYMKESGCRPEATNPAGCRGIGQACPGSKLPCENDFACQHNWFTGYAVERYGSWEQAYNFHLANGWW